MPDNVAEIGDYVFSYCSGLQELTLPAALKNIPTSAFSDTVSLKVLVMQEGVQTIGQWAFAARSATQTNTALEELVIPSSVISTSNYSFQHLTALKKITFAQGSQFETLGVYTFQGCTALESITLPASLKAIMRYNRTSVAFGENVTYSESLAFDGCSSLKYVDMSACVNITSLPGKFITGAQRLETLLLPPNLESIDGWAFGDPLGHVGAISSAMVSLKEIEFPASLTSIGGYVFYGCQSLEKVTFAPGSAMIRLGDDGNHDTDYYWGRSIFEGTVNLKTVVLPGELIQIGESCFANSGIQNIDIPATVSMIAPAAFYNCDQLKKVTLPVELTYLGNEAFYDCDNLEIADLVDGVEYVGGNVFAFCEKLKKVYIPATVTSMAGNPFVGCSGVESFEMDPNNVNFVTKDGILYDKTM